VLTGEQVYSTTCIACHAAGVAGAPKFVTKERGHRASDKAWQCFVSTRSKAFKASRRDAPKGGRVDLADQSISNAVDYMVNAAK